MGDWADEKAREFWRTHECELHEEYFDIDSLAALLREVDHTARTPVASWESVKAIGDKIRADTLAEVRRVVEQAASDVRLACISTTESDAVGALRGALLSRLDKL